MQSNRALLFESTLITQPSSRCRPINKGRAERPGHHATDQPNARRIRRSDLHPPPRDVASVDESRVGPARGELDHVKETLSGVLD